MQCGLTLKLQSSFTEQAEPTESVKIQERTDSCSKADYACPTADDAVGPDHSLVLHLLKKLRILGNYLQRLHTTPRNGFNSCLN